jgi:hypothetical protein
MLADAIQGARRPGQTIAWTDKDGRPFSLVGATISARIRNQATGEVRASDGSFDIIDAVNGMFVWNYSEADVSEAGVFEVQFTATFGAGLSPARTFVEEWRVVRSL